MSEIKDTNREGEPVSADMWSFGISPSRIEALCDGTFAIAMTILVLELSLDEKIIDALAMHGNYDLNYLFVGLYSYVMGFVVLGIYWALHHYIFHFIKRSDGVLVWLNIVFLIFAALVPLSTKVNQTYIDSYAGYVFYALSTIISLLMVLVIWQYATRRYRLVDRNMSRKNVSVITNIIMIGASAFLAIVVITALVPWFAYLGFVPMAYVIVSIATGNDRPWQRRQTMGSS